MSDIYINFLKFLDQGKMDGIPVRRASMNARTLNQILDAVGMSSNRALSQVCTICGVEIIVDRRLSDGGFRNEIELADQSALFNEGEAQG